MSERRAMRPRWNQSGDYSSVLMTPMGSRAVMKCGPGNWIADGSTAHHPDEPTAQLACELALVDVCVQTLALVAQSVGDGQLWNSLLWARKKAERVRDESPGGGQ